MYKLKISFFLYGIFLLFNITVIANEQNLEENVSLEGIYGNSGHIGVETSLGVNTFEYYSLRKNSYFNNIITSDIHRFNLSSAITYFSTDFNRFSFLIEANLDIATDYFSYKSFSFGIIDKIYVNNDWSANLGIMTVFEGNYNFFVNLGVSYYLIKTRNYYLILNNYFNFLLNSVNISNTLYIEWMYIF